MATILKCKMCGGDIEVSPDMTVGVCLYCGSTMTLPRIDTDVKARLFNRANQYRLNNEFDKAYDAYKSIVEDHADEAEAYWGMVLSRYGVEYVEDLPSHKRVPTCHRTLMQPIRSCADYKLACQYADAERKMLYQDEAEILDRLQKTIIAVSEKEDPYDVFICYKDTGDDGQRTEDSVIAQKIYDELTQVGIRVFFSRISLEDKLGKDYEPYIYAALKSARVMLMVSTKEEYCYAVWVKNEWMRFLGFMEEDPSKTIIPVYKDMSPREFPDEFAKYQAQDIAKVGAIQDLVRGVQKLIGEADDVKKQAMSQKDILDIVNENEIQKRRKRLGKIRTFLVKSVVILGGIAIVGAAVYLGIRLYKNMIRPQQLYSSAKNEISNENYSEAAEKLVLTPDYKDSKELLFLCYNNLTKKQYHAENYDECIALAETAKKYAKDDVEMTEMDYYLATAYLSMEQYDKALPFYKSIMLCDDSSDAVASMKNEIRDDVYKLLEYCFIQGDANKSESIIDDYRQAYADERSVIESSYFSLLYRARLFDDMPIDSLWEYFDDYQKKVMGTAGIYYSGKNELYIYIQPDGVMRSVTKAAVGDAGEIKSAFENGQLPFQEGEYYYNYIEGEFHLKSKSGWYQMGFGENNTIVEISTENRYMKDAQKIASKATEYAGEYFRIV